MTKSIEQLSQPESSRLYDRNGKGNGQNNPNPDEQNVAVKEWERSPEILDSSGFTEKPEAETDPFNEKRQKTGFFGLKKALWLIPLMAAIAAIGAVGAMRLRTQTAVQEANPVAQPVGLPVRAVRVRSAPIQQWVFADGVASAVRSKHLTFEVAGTITYIKEVDGRDLREGDRVREGELIAKVDDRKLTADLSQARAGTAEAEQQKSVAIANVEQARANLQQAQATVQQNQATVEQAKAKVEQAKANLAQIQAKVEQAQVGVQQAQVKVEQAQANVVQAEARRGQSQANLGQAKANLQKAEADRELAVKEQQRRLTLYQEGVISRSDFDLYTNKLQNAEAGVEAAKNQVKAAEQDVDAASSQAIAAQKEVEVAKSQVSATQKDVQAARSQVAASQQDIEVAKSQVSATNSQLTAAESQVSALESQVRSAQAQVEAAQAGIDSASSNVMRANVNLEDTALYAPFDGTIAYLNITEGDYWTPQRLQPSADYQNIVDRVPAIVIDPSEFEVNVELPAFEGESVKPGQRVSIVLDKDASAAAAGQVTSEDAIALAKAEGRVFSVSPSVTPGGRAVKVTIRITKGTENLRHGGRVSAWIAVEENLNATVAPLNAFVFRDRKPHVFVVNSETGKVEQRQIELGIEGISMREIREGVNPGDLLVTEGTNRLVDGAPVEVIEIVK